MFIGGLSSSTTQSTPIFNTLDSLRRYFEQFGDVSECVLMLDKNSSKIYSIIADKSRGFGFVTMARDKSVVKLL